MRNLSTTYRRDFTQTQLQLDIDVTLSLLKLSRPQIAKILKRIDRDFDCAKDTGLDFTDICISPDKTYFLRFENPITFDTRYYRINELSPEDKIYLLELIEKS